MTSRISRRPCQALRPFIETVWAVDEPSSKSGERERVLPTGAMHVVFRLSETPLRVFDAPASPHPRTVGCAIVGGARSAFYIRDVSQPTRSVGAQLYPGAASLLLGASADVLAERHTALEDLWGRSAIEARARVVDAGTLEEQLAMFESILAARLSRIHGMHPAVAEALTRFSDREPVAVIVKRSGYSHRRFIQLFRTDVGLSPKLYGRVARFQDALMRVVAGRQTPSWAALAHDAGYSDQSHFNRDFLAFAGIAPGHYLERAPLSPNHVPLLQRPTGPP